MTSQRPPTEEVGKALLVGMSETRTICQYLEEVQVGVLKSFGASQLFNSVFDTEMVILLPWCWFTMRIVRKRHQCPAGMTIYAEELADDRVNAFVQASIVIQCSRRSISRLEKGLFGFGTAA